jgi:hypothetical protein
MIAMKEAKFFRDFRSKPGHYSESSLYVVTDDIEHVKKMIVATAYFKRSLPIKTADEEKPLALLPSNA